MNRLDNAKKRLRAAAELGLASHREEIEVVLAGLEAALREAGDKTREFHSLKIAFDLLEGVVTDQTSRINALERAIGEYLDPSRSRDGVAALQTVLERELGDDGD